jgi:SSS family solute:Na+ symporter
VHAPSSGLQLAHVDLLVFAAYMVVVVLVGLAASRRAGSSKRDNILAGDKLPWWMVGGSIIAANISSHHFVGIMGVAYTRGFVALTIAWPAIFTGFAALLWIFLPFYLRNGFYTMPEYLDRRYGGATRLVYGLLIFLTYVFVEISAVLYLGALVLYSLFGVPLEISIIVLAAFTSVYTIVGGLRAVVWTEMFQLAVLIAGGATLSVMTFLAAGGWQPFLATSNQWHLILPATDPDFPWTQYLGGLVCISVFYNATNQFIVQRALAAKDEWHARMGVVLANYLQFFMPFVYLLPGLVAPLLFPHLEKGDLVFPTLVQHILPHGLVGLVMAGLVAAIMSHISGAINSCTTIAAIDLYLPYLRKNASEAQVVRFGRWTGVAIVVAAVAWAILMISHKDQPVFIYLLNVYGYFTPGIATMFLLGILWKRTTTAGAILGGLATIPLTILLELLATVLPGSKSLAPLAPYLQPFMNRTGIVFWLCMLIAVGVSLATKAKPEHELAGLVWNRESLNLPPELRAKMRGLRSPTLWYLAILGLTIAMYVLYR